MANYKEFPTLDGIQIEKYCGNYTQLPEGTLWWGGDHPTPKVGDRGKVCYNNWGPGVVVRYFQEDGFLGILVKVDTVPKWFIDQCKRDGKPVINAVHTFGVEWRPAE